MTLMEISENHWNENRTVCSVCYSKGVSLHHWPSEETQRRQESGKASQFKKKKSSSYALTGGGWHGEARVGLVRSQESCGIGLGDVWLSMVGPELGRVTAEKEKPSVVNKVHSGPIASRIEFWLLD